MGEKKAHTTEWGRLLKGKNQKKLLSKNLNIPKKGSNPNNKIKWKKEEENAFILTERRKTGKSLPTKFPLNERPGKNPKELLNLSKRNNISDQYPDLSAATRLSHLNSNEKSNDQYPDLSLCEIPNYPTKKDLYNVSTL